MAREKGFYVYDLTHGVCHRGPYKYAETAGAVRAEMESHEGDGCHQERGLGRRPRDWNLAVVDNEYLDAKEATP